MAAPKTTIWKLDPHTRAKHAILHRYLQAWTPILTLGGFPEIVYVDGFAGPGRYSEGEDGSPIIALKAVIAHGERIGGKVRFLFVEKDKERADVLQSIIDSLNLPQRLSVKVEGGRTFEQAFDRFRLDHLGRNSRLPPTFAFIDPFGWTGVPFRIVDFILSQGSCEVFVTFMYEEINRFLDHPDQLENFNLLFGNQRWHACKELVRPNERRRCLHDAYLYQLSTVAKFARSFEMRNRTGSTDYFLFYATNNIVGLKKMKEAMWKVDRSGEFSFSDATDPHQSILFGDTPRYEILRKQILDRFAAKEPTRGEIEYFVLANTAFRETHYKQQVLKELEVENKIVVVNALPGRKRGTFAADAMRIRFS